MSDINLKDLLKAIDTKDRRFYDNLSEDQKKKFSPFLALKWSSVVRGDETLEHYYAVSANTQINKNFWDIGKHPKLQWLLVTCVSPGIGTTRHEWLGNSKNQSKNPLLTALMKIYPNEKVDNLKLLASTITEHDFMQLMKDQGIAEKEIKNHR